MEMDDMDGMDDMEGMEYEEGDEMVSYRDERKNASRQ